MARAENAHWRMSTSPKEGGLIDADECSGTTLDDAVSAADVDIRMCASRAARSPQTMSSLWHMLRTNRMWIVAHDQKGLVVSDPRSRWQLSEP